MLESFKETVRGRVRKGSLLWRTGVAALYLLRLARARLRYRALRGAKGLEIGGPSSNFRDGVLPVYPFIGELDGCNFAAETIWEGRLEEGRTFRYHPEREAGAQHICDATDLSRIAGGTYDFVLSSHALEHIANPVKALKEWLRVLKDGGRLLLMLPHRDGDGVNEQLRPLTSLEHLAQDYERGVTERDDTHIPGLLKWLDERADAPPQEIAFYRKNLENFYDNRALHHHVFDTRLAAGLADFAGLRILSLEAMLPCHIVIYAEKPAPGEKPDNSRFLYPGAACYRRSPFPADRPA
jgi:SAM-dependent methyltransferase